MAYRDNRKENDSRTGGGFGGKGSGQDGRQIGRPSQKRKEVMS